MDNKPNIIIADESAMYFYMHSDGVAHIVPTLARANPLANCPSSAEDLRYFNPMHPLYGGVPVSILVSDPLQRRQSKLIKCRYCKDVLPRGSFFGIKGNVYVASPELLFARMGNLVSEMRLAEIGMNLCGRYYIDCTTSDIKDREVLLTTPEKLAKYLESVSEIRGAHKALKALRWVVGNSGSPLESKMKLQFCSPLHKGGFALPFTHMNYDVKAGRFSRITEQSEFCIDMVDLNSRTGLEYDGVDSHEDVSKDKRRRNALEAMGWKVFAIDKTVLYNPEATVKAGMQLAQYLGKRQRFSSRWRQHYQALRNDLGLPA